MSLARRQSMIENAVHDILVAIGEDPDREGLVATPRRVAKMYLEELAVGNGCELSEELSTTFNEPHSEMIVVKNIAFYSLCEHHMVPYHGHASIGYIPQGKVVGLSKIARLLECASRRLTIQERLTTDVAEAMEQALAPAGVMVVISAEHLCMSMRGIKKAGAVTTTSAVRGVFQDNPAAREEFLRLTT